MSEIYWSSMKKIGILGGGVWGSALAKLLSNNKVCIYARR